MLVFSVQCPSDRFDCVMEHNSFLRVSDTLCLMFGWLIYLYQGVSEQVVYMKLRSTVFNMKHPEVSGVDTYYDNVINIILVSAHVFALVISFCFVMLAAYSFNHETWYFDRAREIEGVFYLFDSVVLIVGTMLLFCFAHHNDHLFS